MSITNYEIKRKNMIQAHAINGMKKHEVYNRNCGRTTGMLIKILSRQEPTRVIGWNGKHAAILRDRFLFILNQIGIPHDNIRSEIVVKVRKFGPTGGTFSVEFTCDDILKYNTKRDPENLKIYYDER